MLAFITVLILFYSVKMTKFNLPIEIFHEIDSFLNFREIFKLRLVNRVLKEQAEDYGKRNVIKRKKFGLIRDWQLLHLKSECFELKEQIYKPILCKNHLLLLKFIANYPEFRGFILELKWDIKGFIKPMIKYYEKRINELNKFVEIFDCEYLMIESRKNYCASNYEFGAFLLLVAGLKCMQG